MPCSHDFHVTPLAPSPTSPLTLDSHSMPAREMASSTVTVTTPMIRMSLTGSTMGEPYSWGLRGGQAGYVLPLGTPPRLLHLRHSFGVTSPRTTQTQTPSLPMAPPEQLLRAWASGPPGSTQPRRGLLGMACL